MGHYKLVFTQKYDKKDQQRFLELEQNFIELEKRAPGMIPAKRYQPVLGKEPTNTLRWEAEVFSMEDAIKLLEAIEGNEEHSGLLEEQVGYIKDHHIEIFKEIEQGV